MQSFLYFNAFKECPIRFVLLCFFVLGYWEVGYLKTWSGSYI